MTTEDICKLPVKKICGGRLFHVGNFPKHHRGRQGHGGVGFTYKTAAFVWIKKNRRSGGNFWGNGHTPAQTRRCACWAFLLGSGAKDQIRGHRVHQVIEAPFEGHSKKPSETRRRIVELLGTFPGWKCSPGTAPRGGTPGEMRPRRNRRTTWHKETDHPPAGGYGGSQNAADDLRNGRRREEHTPPHAGIVEYIHPRGNFHTVAFEVRGKIIKESFQGVAV